MKININERTVLKAIKVVGLGWLGYKVLDKAYMFGIKAGAESVMSACYADHDAMREVIEGTIEKGLSDEGLKKYIEGGLCFVNAYSKGVDVDHLPVMRVLRLSRKYRGEA